MKGILFIISLPRSGSTILQKLLCTSSLINSSAEPWLLLPLFAMSSNKGKEVFNRKISAKAISEFDDFLKSNTGNSLNDEIALWVQFTYGKLAPEGGYFLDKTPRYYHLEERLIDAFSNFKFIFLFRNPLEVFASKIKGHNGKLGGYYSYRDDLFKAPSSIMQMYTKCNDGLGLSYYDMTRHQDLTSESLNHFLDVIDIDSRMIDRVKLKGSLGDFRAMTNSDTIRPNDSSWSDVVNSPIRYYLFRRLLATCPDEFLVLSKENRSELEKNLQKRRIVSFFNIVGLLLDSLSLGRGYVKAKISGQ